MRLILAKINGLPSFIEQNQKAMRLFFTCLLGLFMLSSVQAQSDLVWTKATNAQLSALDAIKRDIYPSTYRAVALDLPAFKQFLSDAPMEFTNAANKKAITISLPMPGEGMMDFRVVESPVMKPGLASKYPNIKTFSGEGIEDARYSTRFDYTEFGFHAIIRTPESTIYIDPYAHGQDEIYMVYNPKDYDIEEIDLPTAKCGFEPSTEIGGAVEDMNFEEAPEPHAHFHPHNHAHEKTETQVELRVYDVALACTGEFGANLGNGTVGGALSAMNTAINRVNEIFINEVAMKLELIENNDLLVFLNSASDPYTMSNNGGELLSQNTAVITSIIPANNFDIGHVFTMGCTDVGGIASLGSVCNDQSKARGVTCFFSNNIEFIAEEIMAHELGHQFSAAHSWSNCPGNMGQLATSTAYEPGSGSTIMSYSGSCGDQNIQFGSDDYYHVGNLDEMIGFSRFGNGNACPDVITTDNIEPTIVVPYEDGFYIPISTPFRLTAIGEDPDGTNLTFCWEQYNLGPTSPIGAPIGNAPTFRTFPPDDNPTRIFPRLPLVLGGVSDDAEVLPTYDRDFTFRCTARDNDPIAGGTVWDEMEFKSTASAGPFLVQHPNAVTDEWTVGDYTEVTWDVANTDNDLVDCKRVNILLSVDGGFNWTYTLLSNTPNTGSAMVSVPDLPTNSARIIIEAADNIFFDISDQNFKILEATEPGFTFDATSPVSQQVCVPNEIALDFSSNSILGYEDEITLEIIDGLPADVIASWTNNPLSVGETTTLDIDFNALTANDELTFTIQGITGQMDTFFREVYFEIVYNDFSALELESPSDGASNIDFGTEFTWTDLPNADLYDIQIATSPAFGSTVIDGASDLEEASFTSTVVFEESSLYFWQVRPSNVCGEDEFNFPFVFQTKTLACDNFVASNVPLGISSQGTPTVSSELTVFQSGVIDDVNVTDLVGFHESISDIEVSLISPEGTQAILFSGICGNSSNFNLDLDDESPLPVNCPPIDGQPYQPEEPLSIFDGENTSGPWKLQVKVLDDFGNGGLVENWGVEFCASFDPKNPFLVINDTLPVRPGLSQLIWDDRLLAEDEDNTAEELWYTVVMPPQHGTLTWWNNDLDAGGEFRQISINSGNVHYTHNGDDAEYDSFYFVIEDKTGGFVGITKFDIKIDPTAPIATKEVINDQGMEVFPNPTNGLLNILMYQPIEGEAVVRVMTIQGQELQQHQYDTPGDQMELDLQALPNGIYLLNVQTKNGQYTQKVTVQK